MYTKEERRQYNKKNKEAVRAAQKRYYDAHKEEILAQQREHRKKHPKEYASYQINSIHRAGFESISAYQKALRQTLRNKIFVALGGRCAHCGFTDARALQIDHVYGDGAGRRRKVAYITHYRQILKEVQAGSDRYQLLCANCNWIKRHENGEHTAH